MTDSELTATMIQLFSIVFIAITIGFLLFLFWRKRDVKKRLTPGQIEWLRVQEYGEKPQAPSQKTDEA